MATARKKKSEDASVVGAAPVTISAFKGFDKDLRCLAFQYEIGKSYSISSRVEACSRGFHACENPWDVLSYYPLLNGEGGFNRFGSVDLGGKTDRHGNDKIAAAEITIRAELNFPAFIGKLVDWVIDFTKPQPITVVASDSLNDKGEDGAQIGSSGNGAQIGSSGNDARIGSSGNGAQIGSSGYDAQIGSSGNGARIGSSGNGARIGSSGNDAQIGSSGNDAQIGSSGYGAQIGSSGNAARIGSSGYDAQIGSSGNDAQIGSSGNGAQIDSTGEDAVIASAGKYARVKGAIGAWISLAEFNDEGKCVGFATGCIGQDGLLADTWYRAEAGKLVVS
jgi:hypothetical protein